VEITLARADGERQAAIIAAQGRAQSRQIEAEAEAKALELIAAQLRNNPDLVRYEFATRLAPGVNTVLLPTDSNLILGSEILSGQ
jgi:regulator of protease activity HflC (stomatin/prohibitin superfamily)